MKPITAFAAAVLQLAAAGLATADSVLAFSSGDQRVAVLELYSSQGCSSCPPAEDWISQYADDPALFTEVVPLVFHVDYWDYLGWKDPFSDPRFSARQRQFKRQGLARSVYTPGFYLNGAEWRGWFRGLSPRIGNKPAPALSASVTNRRLSVSYDAQEPGIDLHVAVLGFGLETQVNAGENRRKTLTEDFVVLSHQRFAPDSDNRWDVIWPKPNSDDASQAQSLALALWVTKGEHMRPLQATGSKLPQGWFK